jgi:asparagine synthase (glutamine-hydrolysing)
VATPRAALDDVIRPSLVDGPCYVTFSGGRDSSAILAAATDLARREGLELPVPVTRVYPDLPDTDESQWQRMVIEHLGLQEWVRFEFRDGESDLLGDAALAGLRRRGPVWPPALHAHDAVFGRLGQGALLTGEGGDAVLGARRIAAITLIRRTRRAPRQLLFPALRSVLPRPLLRHSMTRMARSSDQARWLRPEAMAEHVRRVADDASAEPMRYSSSVWAIPGWRSFATIRHNHTAAAAEHGLRAVDPLLEDRFVASLARAGNIFGFGDRTRTMWSLFSDLLPPAVLSRPTKAAFNHAHTGDRTREFARTWDGLGVDDTLVDPERLRQVWLSESPTMATGMLLHQAWLASRSGTLRAGEGQ